MPQFNSFSEFIEYLARAQFGFETIWKGLVDLYYSVTQNPDIESMWSALMQALAPVMSWMSVIFIVVGAVVGLFGKKMFFVLKFAACFLLGFIVGVHFLSPVMPESIPISAWIIGLVMAVIFAVLFKFVYIAIYSVAILYSVYRLCYYGFFLIEAPEFSLGKLVFSLVVASIVLIVSFILYSPVEMLITSFLGSWFFIGGAISLFSDLSETSWVLELILITIVAVGAFIFQVRTRRRY